ncbi:MAG: dienelactone hydrolase family protein [Verrucomicrobiales bacterium]|nr:dienelactone hydrolase family protein [Verrucomicrobiales bacterium]
MGGAPARAEIVERPIAYESDGTACEGWLTYDDAVEGARPGVLIVHQWQGLTDYEKMRARMLAEMGYRVFAADVYGKGVRPEETKECAVQSGKYKSDRKLYRQRLNDALKILEKQPGVDRDRLAAIGYCFGGTGVLELARSGAPVLGVVSFHGGLDSPDPKAGKKIRGRVLALHGADDPYVGREGIDAFEAEMEAAGVDYQLVEYPGAVHSFTQKDAGNDPSQGRAYNAEADAQSWAAMKAFLAEIFQN